MKLLPRKAGPLPLSLCLMLLLLIACSKTSATPTYFSSDLPKLTISPVLPSQPFNPSPPVSSHKPAATLTITASPLSTPGPILNFEAFKNMRFCQLAVGCVTFVDGKFKENDSTGRLLTPHITGDLNGDNWDDSIILIEEKYGDTVNIDLVVLLNWAGQPVEATSASVASAGVQISSLSIENSLIVIERAFPVAIQDPTHPDPRYAVVRSHSHYRLSGDRLVEEKLITWAQDGTIRMTKIVSPGSETISDTLLGVTVQLTTAPYQQRLFYEVYDVTGMGVFNGESPVTQLESGEYQISIDLSRAAPGLLRIIIQDFYTTPNFGAFLTHNTVTIDYQPAERAIPEALFSGWLFEMMDADHGWASRAGTGDLLQTDDGGQTWQTIVLPFEGYFSFFALDAETAWVYPSDPDPSHSRKPLFRTSDGGRTWEPLPVINATTGRLFFLNKEEGFYEDHPEGYYMMGQTRFVLYRTLDGGQTWELMFDNTPDGDQAGQDPHRGTMVFRDTENGWVWDSQLGMVAPGLLFFMRTYDGGRTWQDVTGQLPILPTPPNTLLSQTGVYIFDLDHLIMPVVLTSPNGQRSVRLYSSLNAGLSWHLSSQAIIQPEGEPRIIPFSAQTILIWDGKSLQRTDDGGITWSVQPFHTAFSGSLAGLEFVTPNLVYALVNDHNPNALSTNLYRSTDGGRTWQQLPATILP